MTFYGVSALTRRPRAKLNQLKREYNEPNELHETVRLKLLKVLVKLFKLLRVRSEYPMRFQVRPIFTVVKTAVASLISIGALVVTIAWLAGMFEEKIEPGETKRAPSALGDLQIDVVHEVHKDYIEESIGTLKAASRSVISAKVLATIEEITVSAGDRVSTGTVLVRLDSKEFVARLNQAQEALVAARASGIEANQAHERAKKLLPSRAISTQEYETILRNHEIAKAEQRKAQLVVLEAKVLLSYTTIKAPKSGRIVDRLAEPGDNARPGIPLLVLYDATSLRLEAPVLEHLAVKLKTGQTLDVYVDSLQKNIQATIDEIVPQADAPSRSFLVKASLPRSDDLYEGMFGRLRIPAGSRRHLCLATDAIQRVGQLEFVEVLRADNTLERRFIKVGRLGIPGRVEVLSGVQSGEQVILRITPNSQSESTPR